MASAKQNYVQFLSPENLAMQQKLMAGYYQQMVQMYGISIEYFRRKYEFFDPDGLLDADGDVNWTYGYDNAYEYGNVVNMQGYIEMGNDAFIFSMIGGDSEQDGKVFFTKEQFELDFLSAVGRMTTETFETNFTVDIEAFEGTYLHTENYEPFSITFSDDLTFSTPGVINEPITLTVTNIESHIRNDICGNKAYIYNWLVQGNMTGTVTGTLDANGDGTLTIQADGPLTYNRPATDEESNGWGIAPQSGDFIRITYGDSTTEDFAITSVTDRDLNNDGISPFLGKLVWKCNFTRRSFGQEVVPSGEIAREVFENNYLDQIVNIEDDISDEIFDYELADPNNVDDDVYGGF